MFPTKRKFNLFHRKIILRIFIIEILQSESRLKIIKREI